MSKLHRTSLCLWPRQPIKLVRPERRRWREKHAQSNISENLLIWKQACAPVYKSTPRLIHPWSKRTIMDPRWTEEDQILKSNTMCFLFLQLYFKTSFKNNIIDTTHGPPQSSFDCAYRFALICVVLARSGSLTGSIQFYGFIKNRRCTKRKEVYKRFSNIGEQTEVYKQRFLTNVIKFFRRKSRKCGKWNE